MHTLSDSSSLYSLLPYCQISLNDVMDGFYSLLKSKSLGPDGISGFFLSIFANFLAYPTFLLYSKSLAEGVFPPIWKIYYIKPIFKKK